MDMPNPTERHTRGGNGDSIAKFIVVTLLIFIAGGLLAKGLIDLCF